MEGEFLVSGLHIASGDSIYAAYANAITFLFPYSFLAASGDAGAMTS